MPPGSMALSQLPHGDLCRAGQYVITAATMRIHSPTVNSKAMEVAPSTPQYYMVDCAARGVQGGLFAATRV